MKVKIVFELDDNLREAIAYRHGDKRKASKKDIKTFIQSVATAAFEDCRDDYYKSIIVDKLE